jgi:hypothetical protein
MTIGYDEELWSHGLLQGQHVPGGSEDTTKTSVTVAGVRIEMRNLHLQNTSETRRHPSQFSGSDIFWAV